MVCINFFTIFALKLYISQFVMNIANNIKAVANRHGKTISQIAEEMGVAQSHLSRTINNERISLKDLEAISEKIGCKVADFFEVSSPSHVAITCPKCGEAIPVDIVVRGE